MKLMFYEDPGHGWLAVPYRKLVKLGIHRNISPFSYRSKGTVFLEEDVDMGIFLRAAYKAGLAIIIIRNHTNRQSKIRKKPDYFAGEYQCQCQ